MLHVDIIILIAIKFRESLTCINSPMMKNLAQEHDLLSINLVVSYLSKMSLSIRFMTSSRKRQKP